MLQPTRLSEVAYKKLRRRILFQDLQPGALLNEMALVEELGLGRTPIREAIQRLSREGLVRVLPRRGVLVAEMSPEFLINVYEARAPCEEQVARCAALRAEAADIDRMRESLVGVDTLIDEKRFRALVEADERFHVAVYQAAKNSVLTNMLMTLYGLGIRFWYSTLASRPADDVKHEMSLHLRVLEAVEGGDPDKAAHAMLTAIGGFPDRVVEMVRGASRRPWGLQA